MRGFHLVTSSIPYDTARADIRSLEKISLMFVAVRLERPSRAGCRMELRLWKSWGLDGFGAWSRAMLAWRIRRRLPGFVRMLDLD